MKTMSPIRDPDPRELVPDVGGGRHTAGMAIRASVQADTEDECVEGLARLVDAGFLPVMTPRYMTDGRWLARAVPSPTAPLREPVEG